MKSFSLKRYVLLIRLATLTFLLCMLALILFSFTASKKIAGDFWLQLGIAKAEGTKNIEESFLSNYFTFYGAKNARNILAADRVAVARDLLNYTRQYVSGAAFQKAYAARREQFKPRTPEYKIERTKAQVQKEEIGRLEKTIKDAEELMKKMTPEVQKGMAEGLAESKKQLKEYQNPDYPLFALLAESDVNENTAAKKRYEEEMALWEKNMPADYKLVIKERLERMLTLTAGVDYDAALKDKYNKKVFVNATYERKPAEWKMAFRAGKEITELTRAFAQNWLNELK